MGRSTVQKMTQLSFPTISQIVSSLIEEGMVRELDRGSSTGGRRPTLLGISADFGHVVGVKLVPGQIDAVVTDFQGRVLASYTSDLDTRDPDQTVSHLLRIIQDLMERSEGKGRLRGVGVGLPGVIDRQMGTVRESPLGWRDYELRAMAQDLWRVPVVIDNNVNILAQGHHYLGLAQGRKHVVVVTMGRGMGVGIIINGQVYRGLRGGGGRNWAHSRRRFWVSLLEL